MTEQRIIRVKLTLKQTQCWDNFWDDHITHILFGGAMGGGKKQPLHGRILTSVGFKENRNLVVGEKIVNPNGDFQTITRIHETTIEDTYILKFSNGIKIECCGDHLFYGGWRQDKSDFTKSWDNKNCIKTAKEIYFHTKKELKKNKRRYFKIPITEPIEFDDIYERPIEPYLLGALLGDGCITNRTNIKITTNDKDFLSIFSEPVRIVKFKRKNCFDIIVRRRKEIVEKLKKLNLLGANSLTKFIPKEYKIAPKEIRLALLQGLLDTDGGVSKDNGNVKFWSINKTLAEDVAWVARSLGCYTAITKRESRMKIEGEKQYICAPCYTVYIASEDDKKLFRLSRKSSQTKVRQKALFNTVVDVKIKDKQEMRCITVSNPNGLYITNDFIITHNSYIGCLLLFRFAEWVIRKFNLPITKYPIQIGFMGRYRAVDFNDTTLETWKRIIPDDQYHIRVQDKEIVIKDKVKYAFGGMDSQEAVSKFSSAEFAVVFIDQAEECDRDKIAVLMSRFRLQINGVPLPYKALFTANPANCFLKDEFVLGNDPKKVFIPALPRENPYLPETYMASLKDAFKHRPELLLAYLEGSWDSLEGADIIIKDTWVREAADVHITYVGRAKKVFGVDVARYGDDRTVIYYLEGTDIKDEMIFGQKDTMYTAGKVHIWAQEKKPDLIGVDVIGLGAGVVDRLREMGDKVLEVNSSEKPHNEEKFRNLRAEMWWSVGRRFAEKDIRLTWTDPELRRELGSVSYQIKDGKLKAEPKEDIKKRLMRSPDKADAYIIGLHTLDHAVISKKWSNWEKQQDDEALANANEYTGG